MTLNLLFKLSARFVPVLGVALGSHSTLASGEDFVAQAKQAVAAATHPSSTWDGPVSGPKAQPNKFVVFVASDLRNGGVLRVSDGFQKAAQIIGWRTRVLDGQGTVSGRTSAMNQAIALRPAGIVAGGFDAKEQSNVIHKAAANNILVVGWHSGTKAGPDSANGLFANVTTNPSDVARIAALYAIAGSEGKAGVVIFTDSQFAVAVAKSDEMAKTIRQCTACKLLSVEDTPLSETSTRMPQLTTSLLQKYGPQLTHILGINDLYFDFIAPSLQAAGRKPSGPPSNLSGGDGSESAYQRIRSDRYQSGTVPEPLYLHGWQVVDELNRAFAGVAWSGYSTAVHLVTKENIKFDGGDQNLYDPANHYEAEYRKIWGR